MSNGEVREVKKVEEVKDVQVAAFFDLDGTLTPLPSLERRFFRVLRYRREVPLKNYFLWLKEALRLLPYGVSAVTKANKMYLRGVQSVGEDEFENRSGNFWEPTVLEESGAGNDGVPSAHASGQPERLGASQAGGQTSAAPPKRARRNPRLPVPRFFANAVERVAWHAKRGHAIVLVSGTLEPLATAGALELEAELAARMVVAKIRVCATRLEEIDRRWTGGILGEAMFGEAKARAIRALAQELKLDLARCYAYGDSANDEAVLACVGNPIAVNPSRRLARIAHESGWPLLRWAEGEQLTERAQSSPRVHRRKDKKEGLAQTHMDCREAETRDSEKRKNESALRQTERMA